MPGLTSHNPLAVPRGGPPSPSRAREGVAEALAWQSVEEDGARTASTSTPTRPARPTPKRPTRRSHGDPTSGRDVPLAPRPPAADPAGLVAWDAIRADGADGLAVRAGRKLVDKAQLYEQFNPALIRMALDGPLATLWTEGHVAVGRLWDTFNRYLYLQRLTTVSTLVVAAGEGPASVTWQTDGFALADAHDGTRYLGLITGERATSITTSTLLVRPDVAAAQRSADLGESSERPGESATDGSDTTEETGKSSPKVPLSRPTSTLPSSSTHSASSVTSATWPRRW